MQQTERCADRWDEDGALLIGFNTNEGSLFVKPWHLLGLGSERYEWYIRHGLENFRGINRSNTVGRVLARWPAATPVPHRCFAAGIRCCCIAAAAAAAAIVSRAAQ